MAVHQTSADTRIALIGIIIENTEQEQGGSPAAKTTEEVNGLLHQYNQYIVGRMGIPYKTKGVAIISIIMDAPNDVISSLSGKLGMIQGISVKTMYSKVV